MITPQEFVELSNQLSNEIREKYEPVQFESQYVDGQGKFYFYNKEQTYCLGFNTAVFNVNAFSAICRCARFHMRNAANMIVKLGGGAK